MATKSKNTPCACCGRPLLPGKSNRFFDADLQGEVCARTCGAALRFAEFVLSAANLHECTKDPKLNR
ncbi:hypothetical protein JIN85_17000 [Luteolibacter pohnpeiensis]|uniref:Uncharacterized protein n=1 Tax=Luteolibacter pohnpeiensis TaxID=454153 RepID=A0A934VSB4_9BACT|nr:hypothetical protein [Luteolibacter pohnpeiensis]MBK1884121.1 hypothetical protein [Luteolibacter pohnpeiensis]